MGQVGGGGHVTTGGQVGGGGVGGHVTTGGQVGGGGHVSMGLVGTSEEGKKVQVTKTQSRIRFMILITCIYVLVMIVSAQGR